MTKIIKRDGRKAPFQTEKICSAVKKALQAAGYSNDEEVGGIAMKVARCVAVTFAGDSVVDIESVQDAVECTLMELGLDDTAKAYILYRAERTHERNAKSRLMNTYHGIVHLDAKDCETKRENANVDGDTAMGAMLKFGSEGAKEYYRLKVLNPKHSKAHEDGWIHIHDLDFLTLTTTCTQIDLTALFKGGFSTGHGFLREPNSIASYAALAAIAIQSNQNDQHGGQSIPSFDRDMAPGVQKTYHKEFLKALTTVYTDLTDSYYSYEEDSDERYAFCIKEAVKDVETSVGREFSLTEDADLRELLIQKLQGMRDNVIISLALSDRIIHAAQRRARKATDKATHQAMEGFIHNLNTMHSRAGAQTPFSSINYGTDTSLEGRMVIKNLLLTTLEGLGHGETPIFPIQIFKMKRGINTSDGEPNYDLFQLALKCTAKRMFPNFSFIDAPFNLQHYDPSRPETEVAYMGCRTRVIGNSYDSTREQVNGRGNLSFTSINLPRLAIEAAGDIKKFYALLDKMLALVCEQLLERFEIQCRKKVRNFPFLMGQGVWLDSDKLDWDDEVREVLKHGTLSTGFIGLAECLKALLGAHHGESETAQTIGLQIVGYMRAYMDRMVEKTGLNFSLVATPAEGLSGRFVRIDAKKYGIIPGVTDREYYTNSSHVPVYYPISAFKKLQIEAPYHELENAGHIAYVELDGDPSNNLSALETIVMAMMDCGIGYGAINHPLDRDPICGYSGIIGDECPVCGRKEIDDGVPFERIRRITGYLVGTLDRFNNGKRAEEHDRVKHC